MGVLQQIVEENKGHFVRNASKFSSFSTLFQAQAGGFVSPRGNSFIGNSAKVLGLGDEGTVIAIKRIWMDEKIAAAAKQAGAHLIEDTTVEVSIPSFEMGPLF
jgi:hypothetical protein